MAPDLAAFRAVARGLLAREAPPDRVHFDEVRGHPEGLLRAAARWEACGRLAPAVPRDFLGMTRAVLPHRDPGRWALLYRVLWRLTHGEPALLQRHEDTDVRQLRWMEQSVRRDLKAMTDAVRFRRVPRHGREHHVAWYAPEHRILRAVAPFLVRRFASFAWSLFTPDGGAHWDLERLTFAEGTHASGDAAAHAASRARGRSPGPTAGGVPLMLVGMAHEGGDSPSFTGPAGQLLALVLGRAGLLGPTAPVTHGVVPCGAGCGTWPLPEGARTSCRHGLDAAVARARPRMVIALGAQAAQAFLGVGFRIHISRGQVLSSRWAEGWMATLETEAIVRLTGARERAEARIHLEADFRSAAAWLRQRSPGDGVRPRVG
ncbi:Uracil-DNA glycosylase, putative family 6 [Myxococcus hansupus]|uniref:Uracil-DNA glycosylase, putative family 6 n=1 Tax=Pseudomyxococcus hansupus TaxID=1297742 RepID=A0A0H4XDA6_9BACT|nr:Uracil-DNA glycosylase, putative family 6 [Myxococcus hansupus]